MAPRRKKTDERASVTDEAIWYRQNVMSFFSGPRWARFFPTPSMSFAAQMNSLVRFSVYFAVLLLFASRSLHGVYLVVFALGFTYFLYAMKDRTEVQRREIMQRLHLGYDDHAKRTCKKPTDDNPYMNVLASEYGDDPKRPPAGDVQNQAVMSDMREKYGKRLVRDVNDVFDTKASDHQFYTTAITTIPNDQSTFADWLYKTQPTCKEGSIQCWQRPLNEELSSRRKHRTSY